MKTTSRLSNVIMCAGLAQLSDARSHYLPPPPAHSALAVTNALKEPRCKSFKSGLSPFIPNARVVLGEPLVSQRLDVVT